MSNTQLYRSILAARKSDIIGLLNTPEGAGADFAISLRMLNADLIGQDAIEVKRTANSDFDRFPLTPDGVPLDQIASFCGASDGVASWMLDQSGNERHASQSAESASPTIYRNGQIVTENGLPVLDFDGVDDYLEVVNIDISQLSAFIKLKWVARIQNQRFLTIRNSSHDTLFMIRDVAGLGIIFRSFTNNISADQLVILNASFVPSAVYSYIADISNRSLFQNGTEITDLVSSASGTATDNSFWIGGRQGSTNFARCDFSELILYDANKTAQRAGIENNLKEHYGIS